eukprot:GGOE01065094.1.p1 GENE.GGOE01065094.1~~GGOE01065094.1.p1  ORF type:complete len:149 (+),score=24.82 GGOE01065094.1:59-505(+)
MALWGGLVDGALLRCLAQAWALHDRLCSDAVDHFFSLIAGDVPGFRSRLMLQAAEIQEGLQAGAVAAVRGMHYMLYVGMAWHTEMMRLRQYPDWRALVASLLLSAVVIAYAALMLHLVDFLTSLRVQEELHRSTLHAPEAPCIKLHDE